MVCCSADKLHLATARDVHTICLYLPTAKSGELPRLGNLAVLIGLAARKYDICSGLGEAFCSC